jgi:4-hydroxy-tetrahydrodipicolinate reductase
MIRIAIAGIGGRMGREILAAAAADSSIWVVGGTVNATSIPAQAETFGSELTVGGALSELPERVDVVIDFTKPGVTLQNAHWCAAQGVPFVSGTTGLSAEQLGELQSASERAPIFYARNMSLGLNALIELLPRLVMALDGYDIEITETHHRGKKDAPSGTALALAEAIAAGRQGGPDAHLVYGRTGLSPRTPSEIGMHSLRAGGNAGEHTVLFADEGEEVRLTHRALSRATFALGALRAAKFLAGQPPGWYSMTDLIRAGT